MLARVRERERRKGLVQIAECKAQILNVFFIFFHELDNTLPSCILVGEGVELIQTQALLD